MTVDNIGLSKLSDLGLNASGSFNQGASIAQNIINSRLQREQNQAEIDIRNRETSLREQSFLMEKQQKLAFQKIAEEAYKYPDQLLPQLYAKDPDAAAKISNDIQQRYSSQYNTLKLLTKDTKAEDKQAVYTLLRPELERQFPELEFGDRYSTELGKSLNNRESALKAKMKNNLSFMDTAQGVAGFNPQTGEATLTGLQSKQSVSPEASGGATGYNVRRIMKDTGLNYTQALQKYQTGFRTGTEITPEGGMTVTPGAEDAKTRLKAAEAEGSAFGKDTGEKKSLLRSMTAKMPELQNTVGRLHKLGELATYTTTGKVANEARKELGLPTSQGAINRAEYISVVDNQVLPLLRDTFGAQFTENESKSLKTTLGDPDKTPAEKDAVLKSFIKQKIQSIESLEREVGKPKAAKSQDYSEDDIAHTAQKYGISPEEVRRRLKEK